MQLIADKYDLFIERVTAAFSMVFVADALD
jgi:hypothetical protein